MKKISVILVAVFAVLGCEKAAESCKTVNATLTNLYVESNAAGDLAYDFCAEQMVGFKTDAGDRSAAKAGLDGPGQMSLKAKVSASATKIWFYTRGAVGEIQTFTVPEKVDFKSQSESLASMVYCSNATDIKKAETVSAALCPVTSAVVLNILDSKGELSGRKISKVEIESADSPIAGDISLNFEKAGISAISNESKKITITGTSLKVGTAATPTSVTSVVIPASFTGTITITGDNFTSVTTIGTSVGFQAGYIRTVNVDLALAKVTLDKSDIKKRVGVLGDSISSFNGMIPSGYSYYYPKSDCDVDVWQKTYWGLLITEYWDAELDKNVSWSGGCVAYNVPGKAAGSDFVTRVKGFENPDIILIHGGTNDCISSNGVNLGELDFTSPYGSLNKNNRFCESYIAVIKYIQANWPDAVIIIILGDQVYGDFAVRIREIAAHYELPLVDFTSEEDIRLMTKYSGSHPDANGMKYMAEKIYNQTLDKIK